MKSATRSNTDLAKSALGGLATFGAESGRLIGRGAKALWKGARKVTSNAASKAKDTAVEARETVAAKLD
jgi:hypothetical protein